jgi:hypothetical protein
MTSQTAIYSERLDALWFINFDVWTERFVDKNFSNIRHVSLLTTEFETRRKAKIYALHMSLASGQMIAVNSVSLNSMRARHVREKRE